MAEAGQKPVVLSREIEGFALNRIQYAILSECWRLIDAGILSVKDIDSVMSDGLGPRYAFLGPMETAHLNAEGMQTDLNFKFKVNLNLFPTISIHRLSQLQRPILKDHERSLRHHGPEPDLRHPQRRRQHREAARRDVPARRLGEASSVA